VTHAPLYETKRRAGYAQAPGDSTSWKLVATEMEWSLFMGSYTAL